jgi:hypothetical protein
LPQNDANQGFGVFFVCFCTNIGLILFLKYIFILLSDFQGVLNVMKNLILSVILLFSAQVAFADFAADLAAASEGDNIATLVETALANNETPESIAAAMKAAGISDIDALNVFNQANWPTGQAKPDMGSLIDAVADGYDLSDTAAVALAEASLTLPARVGTGTTISNTTSGSGSGSGSGAGGGGGGGGGVSVSLS